jgi:hypothetical protein
MAARLSEQASELAREGRVDEAAVQQLRRLGRWSRRINAAAKLFLVDDAAFEDPEDNAAYRLLVAARDRQPLSEPPPEVAARMRTLHQLRQMDPVRAFGALAERRPKLRNIRFDPKDRQATYRSVVAHVGPGTSDDPIVNSHAARQMVLAYFRHVIASAPPPGH